MVHKFDNRLGNLDEGLEMIRIARAKTIRGYMPEYEMKFLAEHAQNQRYIVEVGVWKGRTSRVFADNMLPIGKLWSIDHWQGQKSQNDYHFINQQIRKHGGNAIYEEFCFNLKDHIDAGRVIPVREDSQKGLPKILQPEIGKIGLLFLDGDHTYEGVLRDIDNFSPLVCHGMICGDDYDDNHSQLRKAVDERYPDASHHGKIWYVIR